VVFVWFVFVRFERDEDAHVVERTESCLVVAVSCAHRSRQEYDKVRTDLLAGCVLAVHPSSGRVASEAYGAEHLAKQQVLTETEEATALPHEAIKELVAA
jgi:hypothetical protein